MKTSIPKCMEWFRLAMTNLIPVMDDAKISWRNAGDLPDDFDELSTSLFSVFVKSNCINSQELEREGASSFSVQEYAVRGIPDSYTLSLVVADKTGVEGRFVMLATQNEPFDTVIVIGPDKKERRLSYRDCDFYLKMPSGLRIKDITVRL